MSRSLPISIPSETKKKLLPRKVFFSELQNDFIYYAEKLLRLSTSPELAVIVMVLHFRSDQSWYFSGHVDFSEIYSRNSWFHQIVSFEIMLHK